MCRQLQLKSVALEVPVHA